MLVPTLRVEELEIPSDVFSLAGFRAWVAELGDQGPRVSYCGGNVHVDVTPQNYRSHAPLTAEVTGVLGSLARTGELGMYFSAPSWFTCEEAQLSTEPDGFLTTFDSFRAGRIGINPERDHELLGRPDMVFEAVSKTSRTKDRCDLVTRYALAGIPEYWIADACSDALEFRILVLGEDGTYRDQKADSENWLTSPLWGKRFRLRRIVNQVGLTEFRLDQA